MIEISMTGVKDAIETVKDIVIPWYRQNATRKLKLENALRQAEIQRLNADTLATHVHSERERASKDLDIAQRELLLAQAKKTEAEAALILAQAEKAKVDAEKERAVLRQEQIKLALLIIERYSPNLTNAVQLDYVIRLLPVIERLTWSKVELE